MKKLLALLIATLLVLSMCSAAFADGGKIDGVIFAKKIKVLNKAEISGEINYCYFSVEDGAKIVGKCNCADDDLIETKKDEFVQTISSTTDLE